MTPAELQHSPLLRHEGRNLWEVDRFTGPRAKAFLLDPEKDVPASIPSQPLAVGKPLLSCRIGNDRFDIPGESHGPAWVYVSEPRYPGWKIWLETPAGAWQISSLPALAAFQKIRVPAGAWTLHFRYDPWTWRLGLALSLISLVGFATYGLTRLPLDDKACQLRQ
jgi:hypothetical protein